MTGVLNRRVPLRAAASCALALALGGFWIGRSGPGSAPSPRVLHGTVSTVGRPPGEFAITLDGTETTSSYGLGPVPWTDSADPGDVNQGTTPPCISVGKHVSVAVIAVTDAGTTSDQVVWIECG